MAENPPQQIWVDVENYIAGHLIPHDDALETAREANTAAGLPAIDVAPPEGKFLHLMAKLAGARRILEIGTLGGYSTIWMARALPAAGQLITLELLPRHAEVAQANLERAGVADRVEIRVGPALESLQQLDREGVQPFDLIFIDADKGNNSNYLQWAIRFSRLGSLIIVDNVIRDGTVVDAENPDESTQGSRKLFEALSAEPRLTATALQTVGSKGYDGMAIALVTSL